MSVIINSIVFLFFVVVIPLTILNCILDFLLKTWVEVEEEKKKD